MLVEFSENITFKRLLKAEINYQYKFLIIKRTSFKLIFQKVYDLYDPHPN